MLLTFFLGSLSLLTAIPIATLFVESLSAFLSDIETDALVYTQARPNFTVLIPAHNEEASLADTLQSLKPQLEEQDNIVVIADNCIDRTAQIAKDMGAVVVERTDAKHLGKGYAIDYGLNFLSSSPPEAVFIVDADCQVHPQTLEHVAAIIGSSHRPVQVSNLLELPETPTFKDQISVFAFMVNTFVRPSGLSNMKQPFTLHGTGMAFPWHVIYSSNLSNNNLAEDMQLSLDLAIQGHLPLFCPAGKVTSPLPLSEDAAITQKTRWEHGHLNILLTQVPKLLSQAIKQRRLDLVVLAIDVSIPPLSLLILIWCLSWIFSLLAAVTSQGAIPFLIFSLQGFMLIMSILMAWIRFGQQILSFSSLLKLPQYLLWKIPIYLQFLINPQKIWIRTKR